MLRELIAHTPEGSKKKTILDAVIVHDPSTDLEHLVRSESRVFILYSTKKEAVQIIKQANSLGITKSNYIWIVTQSVIGSFLSAPMEFPVGMLGVHFPTDTDSMISEIEPAMMVFGNALNSLVNENSSLTEKIDLLRPDISCSSRGDARWKQGNLQHFLI